LLEFISKLIKIKQVKFHFIIILIGACVTNNLYDVSKYIIYLNQWIYIKHLNLAIEYANYMCTTIFVFLAYIFVASAIITVLLEKAEKRNIYLDEHLIVYDLMLRSINHLKTIYEYIVIVFLLSYLLNNSTVLSFWKSINYDSVFFYIPFMLGIFCTLLLFVELYTTYFYINTEEDEKSKDEVFAPHNNRIS